jgi:hypothetical protein
MDLNFFNMFFILFIFFTFIFFGLSWLFPSLFPLKISEFLFTIDPSFVGESNSGNNSGTSYNVRGSGSVGTVNINHPNMSVSVSGNNLSNIAASISAAGGATAGIKAAQAYPGPPIAKAIVGGAVYMGVQASTAIMSKVLNNINNGESSSRKFLVSLSGLQ